MKYAIVKDGVVLNVIEYESQPSNPPPGFDADHVAIPADHVGPGWHYENEEFFDPNPPKPIIESSYKTERAAAYPPIGDQLDALFHAGVFPPEMSAQIQAVKDKYPKTIE